MLLKLILRSTLLLSFTISNLLQRKWRSVEYNTNFGKKSHLLMFSLDFHFKNYEKTIFFILTSKVYFRIYCITIFHDLKLSATKMMTVSI